MLAFIGAARVTAKARSQGAPVISISGSKALRLSVSVGCSLRGPAGSSRVAPQREHTPDPFLISATDMAHVLRSKYTAYWRRKGIPKMDIGPSMVVSSIEESSGTHRMPWVYSGKYTSYSPTLAFLDVGMSTFISPMYTEGGSTRSCPPTRSSRFGIASKWGPSQVS